MRTLLLRWWPALVSHLAMILIWHLAVTLGDVPDFVMPTPLEALAAITEPHYHWLRHTAVTATEVVGSCLLAVVIGVGLAIAFSWMPAADRYLMPLIVTLNMVPKVAMAPSCRTW